MNYQDFFEPSYFQIEQYNAWKALQTTITEDSGSFVEKYIENKSTVDSGNIDIVNQATTSFRRDNASITTILSAQKILMDAIIRDQSENAGVPANASVSVVLTAIKDLMEDTSDTILSSGKFDVYFQSVYLMTFPSAGFGLNTIPDSY
jgi:hypothetical protein